MCNSVCDNLQQTLFCSNISNIFSVRKYMDYQIARDRRQYIFRVLAPCVMDEKDLHVDVDKNAIHIKIDKWENEKKEEAVYASTGFYLFEGISQDIAIEDYRLDWHEARCEYKNGIITVYIPRKNPALALFGG